MYKTIAVWLGIFITISYAAEPAFNQGNGTNQANGKNQFVKVEPSHTEIQQLVEQLASKNKPPTRNGLDLLKPADWQEDHQKAVEAAYAKLVSIGKPAFPVLLANLQDSRYSLTRAYSVYVNHSVGDICAEIIRDEVEVVGMRYKSREGADGKHHGYQSFVSNVYEGDLHKWWAANKEKSLKQMKIDAVKWKIAAEEKIGFADAKNRESYMPELLRKLKEIEAGD